MLQLIPKPHRVWHDQIAENVARSSHLPQRQARYGDEHNQERWDSLAIDPPHKTEMETPFPANFENPYSYEDEARKEWLARFHYDRRDTQSFWGTGYANGFLTSEKPTRLETYLDQDRANYIQDRYLNPIARNKKGPIDLQNAAPRVQLQEGHGRNMVDPIDTNIVHTHGRLESRYHGDHHSSYLASENVHTNLDVGGSQVQSHPQDYSRHLDTRKLRGRTHLNYRVTNPDDHTYNLRSAHGTIRHSRQRHKAPDNYHHRITAVPSSYIGRMIPLVDREPTSKYEITDVAPNGGVQWNNRQRSHLTLRDTKTQVWDNVHYRPPVLGAKLTDHLVFADGHRSVG
jgi:hypothetical protein